LSSVKGKLRLVQKYLIKKKRKQGIVNVGSSPVEHPEKRNPGSVKEIQGKGEGWNDWQGVVVLEGGKKGCNKVRLNRGKVGYWGGGWAIYCKN